MLSRIEPEHYRPDNGSAIHALREHGRHVGEIASDKRRRKIEIASFVAIPKYLAAFTVHLDHSSVDFEQGY
ncbi:MAG: hypothetical protein ABF780_09200 [Bifidobacterium aquikefiri]|uniref:hypothetical protein n=1 Tax=Bifidobacterium aquikefiri TaxID=1653207 RepID=UPI000B9B0844|nr:hypothetical protein [Bifidobacterium aquikefiri]